MLSLSMDRFKDYQLKRETWDTLYRCIVNQSFDTLKYENIDISINIDTSILMRKKINIYKIVNGKIMFEIIPISNFFMKKSFPSKRTIFKQFLTYRDTYYSSLHNFLVLINPMSFCHFVWWQMQLANSNELIDWLVNRNWLN